MLVLRRSGNLIEVPGGAQLADEIDGLMSYVHRVGYQGMELTQRLRYKKNDASCPRGFNPHFDFVRRRLYQVRDGSLLLPAGLKSRLTGYLDSRRIPWEFQDLRGSKLPPADFNRLYEVPGLNFRYMQDKVLLAIEESEGGIIVAPTGFGKTLIITLLAKVYPKSRILVVSPGLDLLDGTYERLSAVVPGSVGRIGDGHYEPDLRITLCSADSLHKAYVDRQDLILYDEVHTAGTDKRMAQLCRFTNAKYIGFSASFPGRGDGADDMVSAVFGPILLKVNYADAADRASISPIKVIAVNVPPSDGYRGGGSGVAWERHAYWRNDARNDIIAAAANRIPTWLNDPDPQVLIMVSKLEHGYELRKRLPDYQIVYSNMADEQADKFKQRGLIDDSEEALTPDDRSRLRQEFEAGKLRRAISTYCWKQGVDFCKLGALVRADGGSSSIANTQVPGRLSRLSDGKEFGLLVDFSDGFDPKANRFSESRIGHYEKEHGWQTQRIYDLHSPINFLTGSGTG